MKPSLSVRSYAGVHSACFTAVLASSNCAEIDVPIGTQVTRWNSETGTRVLSQTLHRSLLSDLNTAPPFLAGLTLVASVSHDFGLCIWRADDSRYSLLCSAVASRSGGPVSRVQWSLPTATRIAEDSAIGHGSHRVSFLLATCAQQRDFSFKNTDVCIWRFSFTLQLPFAVSVTGCNLQLATVRIGHYRLALFNAENDLILFNTQPNAIELHRVVFEEMDSGLCNARVSFVCNIWPPLCSDEWNCAIATDYSRRTVVCATKRLKALLFVDALSLCTLMRVPMEHMSPNLWAVHFLENSHKSLRFAEEKSDCFEEATERRLAEGSTADDSRCVKRLAFFPSDGQLEVWDFDFANETHECVFRGRIGSGFTYVICTNSEVLFDVTSDGLYTLPLSFLNEKIAANLKGIESVVEMKKCEQCDWRQMEAASGRVERHSIACCGIDVVRNGGRTFVAVGDLGCHLLVWDFGKCIDSAIDSATLSVSPVAVVSNTTVMSVRSVKWVADSPLIFGGCLDGSLLFYQFDFGKAHSGEVFESLFLCDAIHSMDSAINCIEECVLHSSGSSLHFVLLCGASSGGCSLLEFTFDRRTHKLSKKRSVEFMAHASVDTSTKGDDYRSQFGSLHRAADVWNVVWRPRNPATDHLHFASVSEDQTTRIWRFSPSDDGSDVELQKPKEVAVLRGHSSAVTCVDWVSLEGSGEQLIATCADDRTVMLWAVPSKLSVECTLRHVFRSALDSGTEVLGWFTFTYLRFANNGKLVAATQNGYLCVFDVATHRTLAAVSVHRGSIEGLRVFQSSAVACASDGTVSLVSIN